MSYPSRSSDDTNVSLLHFNLLIGSDFVLQTFNQTKVEYRNVSSNHTKGVGGKEGNVSTQAWWKAANVTGGKVDNMSTSAESGKVENTSKQMGDKVESVNVSTKVGGVQAF
jgi:hypothetical protein